MSSRFLAMNQKKWYLKSGSVSYLIILFLIYFIERNIIYIEIISKNNQS